MAWKHKAILTQSEDIDHHCHSCFPSSLSVDTSKCLATKLNNFPEPFWIYLYTSASFSSSSNISTDVIQMLYLISRQNSKKLMNIFWRFDLSVLDSSLRFYFSFLDCIGSIAKTRERKKSLLALCHIAIWLPYDCHMIAIWLPYIAIWLPYDCHIFQYWKMLQTKCKMQYRHCRQRKKERKRVEGDIDH